MAKVPEGLAIDILNKIASAQKEAVNKVRRQRGEIVPANYDFMIEYLCKYKLPCWLIILFRIYFAHLELIKFGSPQWRYTQSVDRAFCHVPFRIRRLGESVVKKFLIFSSVCNFIQDINQSLCSILEKTFDLDDELEQIYLEGIKCPCLEGKHWDFAYYEGTFASRKLRRIWREIGCPLHHPPSVFDEYDSDE